MKVMLPFRFSRFASPLVCVLVFVPAAVHVHAAPPEINFFQGPIAVCPGGAAVSLPEVAVSSSRIQSGETYAYLPGYTTARWSGSLKKFRFEADAESGTLHMAQQPEWDAAEILTGTSGTAPKPGAALRSIYSSIRTAGGAYRMIEFKWDALSDEQRSVLGASERVSDPAASRLDYLRGDRALELGNAGGTFRARDRLLGDIINSNPVYVGAPRSSLPGDDYRKFFEARQSRRHAVYVGANDGMLHAFDAIDGRELFAYVPNAVMGRLKHLSDPGYVHQPYVDGGITVTEAKVRGRWASVLVAGLGAGSQGLFALDVTDPARFGEGSGALWEFSDEDDPDIGNLPGKPVVAKFRMAGKDGASVFRYFAVVSSGYNNYRDDGAGRFNTRGDAFLFLLALDKQPSERWLLGENYFKFRLPITDTAAQNGSSMPVIVSGADGAARYVYAGDLQGNLWRLSFDGMAPGAVAAPTKPLFRATDASGKPQAITVQPRAIFAPESGYLILFGTGRLLEQADLSPGGFVGHSFYAVHDRLDLIDRPMTRGVLEPRAAKSEGDGLTIEGKQFAYSAGSEGRRGWVLDFVDTEKSGERSISEAVVADGRVFFNTASPGANVCNMPGGRAYVLDVLSGLPPESGRSGIALDIGLPSHPVLIDIGKHAIGAVNPAGQRLVKKKKTVFTAGSGDARTSSVSAGEVSVPAGRLSWREIANWMELRSSGKK